MQNQSPPKEEVIRFLEWIDENPMLWEGILEQRSIESIAPLKTLEDCDMLTFSGLYSVMMTILFSETGMISNRVLKRIAARALVKRIEEIGELETSKEIMRLLNEEWERIDKEAKLVNK
ncbi:hypothetical protein QA584_18750 [Anaerocolumna sp. AGMB13025]|uniref:hypothetical protein n=1 Tax=Anaerocolumna sp. AGMB13025 TaxID=3039116 RepID=UPI00241EAA40|nr:hypothetical protein [Anaerocolumna sp. AGMB13025]WFR55637.1 hypothetical protein QA584_18750 [Anaerocolumna sp. AGMB13025]